MKKIRSGVFETNSSSVHSLVIDKSGRKPSNLPVDEDGYILADYGQFDKDERYFHEQSEKLSYILTNLFYIHNMDKESVLDSYDFENLEEIICKYTGAKGIKILEEEKPYIDHQSIPYGEPNLVDIYNEDSIIDFIFNKYVTLKTDCD